ncbi:hypothetical protein KR054_009269 [Drosophila jambulina]|nr:hypothetical protein KR054_009269 [Drosophila jambulina]
MFIKGLLLLLAASCLSAGRLLPQPEARIIGGQEVDIENAPWQVSLRNKGKHICGGSIYNETIIITAAHCFFNKDKEKTPVNIEDLEVMAGSANKLSSETIVKVAEIKLHSEYDKFTPDNDIAVMKLSEPLDLTTKKMQKIALAEKDPAPGTKARVTGWGTALRYIGPEKLPIPYEPDNLQAIDLKVQKLDYCKEANGRIPNGTICAGLAGPSACHGDSGGPLVVDNKLVGVVSHGNRYCISLSVFTSVQELFKLI